MRAALIAAFILSGCSDNRQYAQAVCVMVDASGTYKDQLAEVGVTVRRALLPRMEPGDSMVVMRIDSDSYNERNVLAAATLDVRPSLANRQKAELAQRLETLGQGQKGARHTDIQGAMMMCREHLQETRAGDQVMVVFSDMKEELPRGITRRMRDDELEGVRVVAMKVKRLQEDRAHPQAYRERLEGWEKRVRSKGARDWQVLLDPHRLVAYLDERP